MNLNDSNSDFSEHLDVLKNDYKQKIEFFKNEILKLKEEIKNLKEENQFYKKINVQKEENLNLIKEKLEKIQESNNDKHINDLIIIIEKQSQKLNLKENAIKTTQQFQIDTLYEKYNSKINDKLEKQVEKIEKISEMFSYLKQKLRNKSQQDFPMEKILKKFDLSKLIKKENRKDAVYKDHIEFSMEISHAPLYQILLYLSRNREFLVVIYELINYVYREMNSKYYIIKFLKELVPIPENQNTFNEDFDGLKKRIQSFCHLFNDFFPNALQQHIFCNIEKSNEIVNEFFEKYLIFINDIKEVDGIFFIKN